MKPRGQEGNLGLKTYIWELLYNSNNSWCYYYEYIIQEDWFKEQIEKEEIIKEIEKQ